MNYIDFLTKWVSLEKAEASIAHLSGALSRAVALARAAGKAIPSTPPAPSQGASEIASKGKPKRRVRFNDDGSGDGCDDDGGG